MQPVNLQVQSEADNVVTIRAMLDADAVQVTFDTVLAQATQEAQTNVALRQQLGLREGDAVTPQQVFEAWAESVDHSFRASIVTWVTRLAAEQFELAMVTEPTVSLPSIVAGKPLLVTLECFCIPELPADALNNLRPQRQAIEVRAENIEEATRELFEQLPGIPSEAQITSDDRVLLRAGVNADGDPIVGIGLDSLLIDMPTADPAEQQALLDKGTGDKVTLASADDGDVVLTGEVIAVQRLSNDRESLAKALGLNSASDLDAYAKCAAEAKLQDADERRLVADVVTHLYETYPCHVPETLVRRRYAEICQRQLETMMRAGARGEAPTPQDFDDAFKRAYPRLEAEVQAGLWSAALVDHLQVRVTNDDIQAYLDDLAQHRGMRADAIDKRRADRHYMEWLNQRLLQSKLVDALTR